MAITKITSWALGIGAAVFVLLLAGVASGALTEDPPVVSPYASGSPGSGPTTTAASADSSVASTGGPTIVIEGFAFSQPATASVGQEVTVLNSDGTAHTWTSRDGLFDSQSLGAGDSFTHVFDTAGTFGFFCGIHPSMTGEITITS